MRRLDPHDGWTPQVQEEEAQEPMESDRGLAALAEREGLVHRVRGLVGVDPHRLTTETVASWTAHAAAILAALHEAGWALVRRAALADQP